MSKQVPSLILASILMATLTLFSAAPASAAPQSPRIRVLSHNVMMLTPPIADYANGTRAGLIANAGYLRGYDVVVLSEAFDNGPSNALKTGLSDQYPHQTPVLGRSTSGWDDTLGDYSWLTPEDGGVTVLSKWPIVSKVQYVYDEACGFDWFSNKGFVYVELDVSGQRVHVVGTHAQAEDSLCSDAAAIRATQFRELDEFLDGLAIPSTEQVIIAGDLNVVQSTPEYGDMLAATDTVAPTAYAGVPFSFDPRTNSLAADRYAGYAPEQLDYVLFRRGNQRPGSWTNTVFAPVSPPWTAGGTTFDDYSDHYPVAGG